MRAPVAHPCAPRIVKSGAKVHELHAGVQPDTARDSPGTLKHGGPRGRGRGSPVHPCPAQAPTCWSPLPKELPGRRHPPCWGFAPGDGRKGQVQGQHPGLPALPPAGAGLTPVPLSAGCLVTDSPVAHGKAQLSAHQASLLKFYYVN